MTKLPDKTRKGELAGTRLAIEAALAATPQRLEKQSPVRNSGPEIVDVLRVCAVHDKPYFAVYLRSPIGRFKLIKTSKVRSQSSGGPGEAGAGRAVSIKAEDIEEGPGETCAWCGAGPKFSSSGQRFSTVACFCGEAVCTGRMRGNVFKCRDSCGFSSPIASHCIPSKGTVRKDAAPKPVGDGSAARPSSSAGSLPANSNQSLRLPPGSSMVKKGGK
jgi:hypothetical protein